MIYRQNNRKFEAIRLKQKRKSLNHILSENFTDKDDRGLMAIKSISPPESVDIKSRKISPESALFRHEITRGTPVAFNTRNHRSGLFNYRSKSTITTPNKMIKMKMLEKL